MGREQRGTSMQTQSPLEKMVFRKTNAKAGRNISVTPSNSTNKHLAYGRIILNAAVPSVQFANGNQETGLICMSGSATVRLTASRFQWDSTTAFIFRATARLKSQPRRMWTWLSSPSDVENRYPLQFVSYAEISKDPTLKFDAGSSRPGAPS